jgi:hypothetical protein
VLPCALIFCYNKYVFFSEFCLMKAADGSALLNKSRTNYTFFLTFLIKMIYCSMKQIDSSIGGTLAPSSTSSLCNTGQFAPNKLYVHCCLTCRKLAYKLPNIYHEFSGTHRQTTALLCNTQYTAFKKSPTPNPTIRYRKLPNL